MIGYFEIIATIVLPKEFIITNFGATFLYSFFLTFFMAQKYDIVVGIPSYNEADNIAFVAKQASEGILKYFPDKKGIIVNVDNDSPDGTKEAFLGADTEVPLKYISTPPGVMGKGNNFYNLFKFAAEAGAEAVVVVDGDITSITPEWIKYMVEPIFDGNDYASPVYSRHKYDGTITNNVCFPLIYGLLGKDMRQPIGGDFAFSGKLNEYWLSRPWKESTRQYGIDIFMTSHAIFGGFKLAKTGLGAKIHKPSAPKLGAMFSQVIRTLFTNIVDQKEKWIGLTAVEDMPVFGLKEMGPAQDLAFDVDAMKANAISRYGEYRFMIDQHLTDETFKKIDGLATGNRFDLGHELWTDIVYDMIASFAKTSDKSEVIESMKALYFYRTTAFVEHTLDMGTPEAEGLIIEQAKHFWKMRQSLISRLT